MTVEEKKKLYFEKYYPSALQCEKETGIPAMATLAQSAMESSWGEKVPGNMFFGIKAGSAWQGKKQLITTREVLSKGNVKFPEIISVVKRTDGKYDYRVKDWFRAYDTPAESFADHGRFLLSQPRYHNAIGVYDPKQFADLIAKSGYATDPNYAKTWKQIIDSLSKFIPTGNSSN